jgi:3'(2'), 5'-bisphosphate nucleotidase
MPNGKKASRPVTNPIADTHLLDAFTAIAVQAGRAILSIDRRALDARQKPDQTPVTAADQASEAVILAALARLLPEVPVISEESTPKAVKASCFILVDPLDGTRDFVAGRPEFAVNLGLIADGAPLLGVIAAPALGLIWRGVVGRGAERLTIANGEAVDAVPIHARTAPADGLTAIHSRSHLDAATVAWVERMPVKERITCGSAMKFGRIADGTADVYPRLSMTCEWDVAAGHAIIAAAGGCITDGDGRPLIYGKESLRVPSFIAWADPVAARRHAL